MHVVPRVIHVHPMCQNSSKKGEKRKLDESQDTESDDDQAHDEVRLWEDGFKDRYYESKFDVSSDNLQFR